MRIVVNGHPALRKVSEPVAALDAEAKKLAEDLLDSLKNSETPGCGLAAPQIGINKRMIVVDTALSNGRSRPGALPGEIMMEQMMPLVLVNPEIIDSSAQCDTTGEGCLSLPEVHGDVTRPSTVVVHATLIDGQEITAECGGLLARCLQHEIDHLNGILFYDRIPAKQQKAAAEQMRNLAKREIALENIANRMNHGK
ncbi:MAG: peptide deformylase [Victivallales bacterium]|nr:peptide deformylase [Victivallales bacterium]